MNITALVHHYVSGLWDRRWSILAIAWLTGMAGLTGVLLLPDRFVSSARVYVDTQTLLAPLMQGLTVRTDLDRQVEVMRRTLLSRPNIEQLTRMTDLDLTANTALEREALLARVESKLLVQPQGSGLFQISYDDTDPNLAQRVVQALLSIFVEQNVGSRRRDMERSRRFIEGQIAEYESQLEAAEARLAEFKRSNSSELGNWDKAQRQLQEAHMDQRRLETELEGTMWRRDQLQLQLTQTPARLVGAAVETVATPVRGPTRADALRQELDNLLLRYTDQHPDVIALRNAVEAAEAQPDDPSAPPVRSRRVGPTPNPAYVQIQAELVRIETDIAGLKRRIDLRRTDVAELERTVSEAPAVEALLAQLNRDYGVLQANYQELIERRESARFAEKIDNQASSIEFRIVEPPVVPVKPSGPNRPLYLAAALAAALAAGFGWGLIRLHMTDAFRSIVQLREAFQLPVLGGISPVWTAARSRLHGVEVCVLFIGTLGLIALFGSAAYATMPGNDVNALGDLVVEGSRRLRSAVGW